MGILKYRTLFSDNNSNQPPTTNYLVVSCFYKKQLGDCIMSKIIMKLLWYYILSFFLPIKKMRHKRDKYKNKLNDYKHRLSALYTVCKDIKIHKIRMVRGGNNIGFIVNNKYVFKTKERESSDIHNVMKEKRITDAFANIVHVKIPKIDIVDAGQYIFCKYEFIPGKNLTGFSLHTIKKHRENLAKQVAKFIFSMHTYFPDTINDLKDSDGNSWGHNDLCNNMIVDTKTMKIVGIIDWEYAGWTSVETEIHNATAFSPKLIKAGFDIAIRIEYAKINAKHTRIQL